MLDIVASYHCMRFQEKLITQTWENGKKPIFRPNFGPFGPKNFFCGFYLHEKLDIVASYCCMQFQEKLWTKLEKMAKKTPSFVPNFGLFGPNRAQKIFFMDFTSIRS